MNGTRGAHSYKIWALPDDVVVAEHLTVIGHEDHDCVLGVPGRLKRIQEPTDLDVNEVARGLVGSHDQPVIVIRHLRMQVRLAAGVGSPVVDSLEFGLLSNSPSK